MMRERGERKYKIYYKAKKDRPCAKCRYMIKRGEPYCTIEYYGITNLRRYFNQNYHVSCADRIALNSIEKYEGWDALNQEQKIELHRLWEGVSQIPLLEESDSDGEDCGIFPTIRKPLYRNRMRNRTQNILLTQKLSETNRMTLKQTFYAEKYNMNVCARSVVQKVEEEFNNLSSIERHEIERKRTENSLAFQQKQKVMNVTGLAKELIKQRPLFWQTKEGNKLSPESVRAVKMVLAKTDEKEYQNLLALLQAPSDITKDSNLQALLRLTDQLV